MFVQGFIPFNNCCCRPMLPACTPFAPAFTCNSVFMPQQAFTPIVNPFVQTQFNFYNMFQNFFQNIWNARQSAPQQTYGFLNLTKNNTSRPTKVFGSNGTVTVIQPKAQPTETKPEQAPAVKTAQKKVAQTAIAKPAQPKVNTAKKVQQSAKQELPTLSEVNYNLTKGNALVQDAMAHRRTTPLRKGEVGKCAAYVKEAIQRTGLGEYINGHAYQCGDIMAQNGNFQEIKVSGKDLKKLPAGCVVVYPRNDVYNRTYGHILITRGDGSSISQFASDKTKASNNARVFVPV